MFDTVKDGSSVPQVDSPLAQMRAVCEAMVPREVPPFRTLRLEDVPPTSFPLMAFDNEFVYDDDDKLVGGKVIPVRLLEYSVNVDAGATKPTLLGVRDGQRFRCPLQMLFPTPEDAMGEIYQQLERQRMQDAQVAFDALSRQAMPALVLAADTLETSLQSLEKLSDLGDKGAASAWAAASLALNQIRDSLAEPAARAGMKP